MYSAKYISDSGITFDFGKAGNNVFDIDGLSGLAVSLGTTQGFGQIGESIETQSVKGKTLTVKGVLYGNIPLGKQKLKKALSAFSKGKLYFEEKYVLAVYVKNAPEFSPIKDNGAFTLQLYAPFPFFKDVEEKVLYIGSIEPAFSFPVNYAQPHIFGVKSAERYINIVNEGDVKTPYKAILTTAVESNNVTLTNLQTLQWLRFTGALHSGEKLELYRDDDGVFRAELTSGGNVEDVLYRVDENSTLFELNVGDNLIMADDDEGGSELTAQIVYQTIAGGVYEA